MHHHAPGESLESLLRHERATGTVPRTPEAAMALLQPIVDVLAVAHARGTGHCSLGLDGILVVGDPRGDACTTKLSPLVDVASSLSDGLYRAPEQLSEAFGIAGPWTDVFTLALVFVALLSGCEPTGGRPDFFAKSTHPARRHSTLDVRIPEAIDAVLVRALAIYPAERWQTVPSFWEALRVAVTVPSLAA
jgi:serine/threonine protein kinase